MTREGWAVRAAFFAAGFAVACWAPLVPFVKLKIAADEAGFGLVLLSLGLGSLIALPGAGWWSARYGPRPVILAGWGGMILCLPLLGLAPSALGVAAVLLAFGASVATLDVAMNVYGADLERRLARPIMSGLHAQFSLGGVVGAGITTAWLILGLSPFVAALIGAGATAGLLAGATPLLRPVAGERQSSLSWPRGAVLMLSVMMVVGFLVEGALLDWGALLLIARGLATSESAGLGFMVFSAAMVVGRLSGDTITHRVGAFAALTVSAGVAIAGIAGLLLGGWYGALSGIALMGLGLANIVPVLFSLAARQSDWPAGIAIATVSVAGYGGLLVGPAVIGLVAERVGLATTFWGLAALVLVVPVLGRRVTG